MKTQEKKELDTQMLEIKSNINLIKKSFPNTWHLLFKEIDFNIDFEFNLIMNTYREVDEKGLDEYLSYAINNTDYLIGKVGEENKRFYLIQPW